MEAVNFNANVLLPLTKEQLDDSNNNNGGVVEYHLNKLLASHFNKNPQEIADASKFAAAAAARAAKAARANADEKAAAAARAVAAAKTALDLIASFPREKHVASADEEDDDEDLLLLLPKDQELPSKLQSISSSSCQHHKNGQLPIGLTERLPNTEHDAISNKRSVVDFNGELVGSSNRLVESSVGGGQGAAKEGIQQQPTRKRGRPKSKLK